MKTHSTTFEVQIDGEVASPFYEVAVDYIFIPGRAERGPTYDCGGEPAEPATAEVQSIIFRKIGDDERNRPWKPMPDALVEFIGMDDDSIIDILVERAADDQPDPPERDRAEDYLNASKGG